MKLTYVDELNTWRDAFPSRSRLFRDVIRYIDPRDYKDFAEWKAAVLKHFESISKKGLISYKDAGDYIGVGTERMRQIHWACITKGGLGRNAEHKFTLRAVYCMDKGHFKGLSYSDILNFRPGFQKSQWERDLKEEDSRAFTLDGNRLVFLDVSGRGFKILERYTRFSKLKVHTIIHEHSNWAEPFMILRGQRKTHQWAFLLGPVPKEYVNEILTYEKHSELIETLKKLDENWC